MLYAIAAVIVLILDQGLKYWISMHMALNETAPLLPGIVRLTYVQNRGAAFSILRDAEWARWLFLVILAIFSAAVIYALVKRRIQGEFGRWTALLVMAGALGNGIDRAINGYVVDMFELQFMNFAVFNVADIFITVCGVLFCLYVIFHKDREPESMKKEAPPKRNPPNRGPSAGGGGAPDRRMPPPPPRAFVNPFETPKEPGNDPFAPGRVPESSKPRPVPRPAVHSAAAPAAQKPQPRKSDPEKKPFVSNGAVQPADDADEFSLESILAEFGDT
jgi:signal peptidase II